MRAICIVVAGYFLILSSPILRAQRDPRRIDYWTTGPGIHPLNYVGAAIEFPSRETIIRPFFDSADIANGHDVQNDPSLLGFGTTISYATRPFNISGLRLSSEIGFRLQTGEYDVSRTYRTAGGEEVPVMEHASYSLPTFRVGGLVGFDISHYHLSGYGGLLDGNLPDVDHWYSLLLQAGLVGSFLRDGKANVWRTVQEKPGGNSSMPEISQYSERELKRIALELQGEVCFEFSITREYFGSIGVVYTDDILSTSDDDWRGRTLSLRTGFRFYLL